MSARRRNLARNVEIGTPIAHYDLRVVDALMRLLGERRLEIAGRLGQRGDCGWPRWRSWRSMGSQSAGRA